jgi:flagellar basal-body rod modification protein FlgD
MAGIANPITSSSSAGTGSSLSSATAAQAQVTEQQFLQLLVAQLKNQDPLNPMDGTQFVSQLAQFSQLEQMIGVNQGVQQLVVDASGTGSTAPGSNTGGSTGTGSTKKP